MNSVLTKGQLFGTSVCPEEASLILLPVPWEVAASFRSGAALGPENILKASCQANPYDPVQVEARKFGVVMLPIPYEWRILSEKLQSIAASRLHIAGSSGVEHALDGKSVSRANRYGNELKEHVKAKANKYLQRGKMVGLVGGDHGTPLGLLEALCMRHADFGILQIDAHAGLCTSYHGFTYTGASIMYHALQMSQVSKLIQVGLRDYNRVEASRIAREKERIATFFATDLAYRQFRGESWDVLCSTIVNSLPDKVYVSFDIDGLDPKLCPGTAMPVPGGLDFDEAIYLLDCVVKAGKRIIGFDLCSVAPSENVDWDAYVGSRLLCRLSVATAASQGRLRQS